MANPRGEWPLIHRSGNLHFMESFRQGSVSQDRMYQSTSPGLGHNLVTGGLFARPFQGPSCPPLLLSRRIRASRIAACFRDGKPTPHRRKTSVEDEERYLQKRQEHSAQSEERQALTASISSIPHRRRPGETGQVHRPPRKRSTCLRPRSTKIPMLHNSRRGP